MKKRIRLDRVDRVVTRSWSKKRKSQNTQKEMTKLSDLNFDCLTYILGKLSTEDLVNAVEYDNELLEAAKWVFKQKTRRQWVSITNEHDPLRMGTSQHVKLLKHFGSEIEHLDISFGEDYHQFDHIIERIVIAKCYNKIISLVLQQPTLYTMYKLNRPFDSVQQVILISGTVCTFMSQFGLWFPNAIKLQLYHAKWSDSRMLDMLQYRCSALREIIIENGNETMAFVQWMTNFIVLHPRITKIKLKFQDSLLALLCDRMPRMPNTHLEIISKGSMLPKMIHFQHLSRLTLRRASRLNLFNISTDRIDFLEIDPIRHYLNLDLLNMIRSNITAKSLNLTCKWAGDEFITIEFIRIVKSMPNLIQLSFAAHDSITTYRLVDMIDGCKSLKWLFIHSVIPFDQYPRINKALGGKWKIIAHKSVSYPLNTRAKVFGYEFKKVEN